MDVNGRVILNSKVLQCRGEVCQHTAMIYETYASSLPKFRAEMSPVGKKTDRLLRKTVTSRLEHRVPL